MALGGAVADGGRGLKPTATCPSRKMMVTFRAGNRRGNADARRCGIPRRNARLAGGKLPTRHAHLHAGRTSRSPAANGRNTCARNRNIWLDRMAAKGWTAPTWPKQYGGGGLSDDEALILEEEMQDLGCRSPLRGMGLVDARPGAAGIRHGGATADHLPPIIRGEIRWCQGYSEPEAGSDLASLRTRAVLQGEHFLVNGHKIWTSNAHKSDWIFCLVRTDPDGEKA